MFGYSLALASYENDTKKVHCPVCGGRICDVEQNRKVVVSFNNNSYTGIIVKCYKCGNKINIYIKELYENNY